MQLLFSSFENSHRIVLRLLRCYHMFIYLYLIQKFVIITDCRQQVKLCISDEVNMSSSGRLRDKRKSQRQIWHCLPRCVATTRNTLWQYPQKQSNKRLCTQSTITLQGDPCHCLSSLECWTADTSVGGFVLLCYLCTLWILVNDLIY